MFWLIVVRRFRVIKGKKTLISLGGGASCILSKAELNVNNVSLQPMVQKAKGTCQSKKPKIQSTTFDNPIGKLSLPKSVGSFYGWT